MKTISDVRRKWFLESFLKTNMRALKIVSHRHARTKVKAGKNTNQLMYHNM